MATATRTRNGKAPVETAPYRPVERDYLRILTAACPPERWQTVVEKAVTLAEGGDAQSRAWLSKYLCGDKTAAHTLDWNERMLADM